jgi:hypothetical protein
MKIKKLLSVGIAVTILLTLFPTAVMADGAQPPIQPRVPLDCGVSADSPVRQGTKVTGVGTISCLTNHSSLRAVVGLRDSAGRYISKEKKCYNISFCATYVSLSYSSGRTWKTDFSGYMGTTWQAYTYSNWVSIP